MKITSQQLINPGAVDYDKKRHKKQERFQESVKRARFLTKEQKANWGMLGYVLTTDQLEEAEQLIVSKNLNDLKTRQKLERIKPKPKK